MTWPDAVMLSVLFVCVAAVLICFMHYLAHTVPAEPPTTKPPEWRSETTTTRPTRPNPSDPKGKTP